MQKPTPRDTKEVPGTTKSFKKPSIPLKTRFLSIYENKWFHNLILFFLAETFKIIPTEPELLDYSESLEHMLEGDRESDPLISFSKKGLFLYFI